MAGPTRLIREAVDLPSHPQLSIPGKHGGQRIFNLVVEGTNREHTGAAAVLRWIIGCPARRSLGVEKPVGGAGHYGHPTDEVCAATTSPLMADWWGR